MVLVVLHRFTLTDVYCSFGLVSLYHFCFYWVISPNRKSVYSFHHRPSPNTTLGLTGKTFNRTGKEEQVFYRQGFITQVQVCRTSFFSQRKIKTEKPSLLVFELFYERWGVSTDEERVTSPVTGTNKDHRSLRLFRS